MNVIRHDDVSAKRYILLFITAMNKIDESLMYNIVGKQGTTVMCATSYEVNRRVDVDVSETRRCLWIFLIASHFHLTILL